MAPSVPFLISLLLVWSSLCSSSATGADSTVSDFSSGFGDSVPIPASAVHPLRAPVAARRIQGAGAGDGGYIGICYDGTHVYYAPYLFGPLVRIHAKTFEVERFDDWSGAPTIAARPAALFTDAVCDPETKSVWLPPHGTQKLVRFDTAALTFSENFELPATGIDFAHPRRAMSGAAFERAVHRVWVCPHFVPALYFFDTRSPNTTTVVEIPGGAADAASATTAVFARCIFDGSRLWIPPHTSHQMVFVETSSMHVTVLEYEQWRPTGFAIPATAGRTRAFGGAVLAGRHGLFLTPLEGSAVVRVNTTAATFHVFLDTKPLVPGGLFMGGCFDGAALWLTPSSHGQAIRVSPDAAETARVVPTGVQFNAHSFGFDGRRMWLTSASGGGLNFFALESTDGAVHLPSSPEGGAAAAGCQGPVWGTHVRYVDIPYPPGFAHRATGTMFYREPLAIPSAPEWVWLAPQSAEYFVRVSTAPAADSASDIVVENVTISGDWNRTSGQLYGAPVVARNGLLFPLPRAPGAPLLTINTTARRAQRLANQTVRYLPPTLAGAAVDVTNAYISGCAAGRYVVFAPFNAPHVLRADVETLELTAAWSWSADASGAPTAGGAFVGAVYDGTGHVWLMPYQYSDFVRINVDTLLQRGFSFGGSWPGSFRGGAFDGRYVWPAPYNAVPFGRIDAFEPGSVDVYHAAADNGPATQSYIGAAFDGRYVWFAPFHATGLARIDTVRPQLAAVVFPVRSGAAAASDGSAFAGVHFDGRGSLYLVSTNASSGAPLMLKIEGENVVTAATTTTTNGTASYGTGDGASYSPPRLGATAAHDVRLGRPPTSLAPNVSLSDLPLPRGAVDATAQAGNGSHLWFFPRTFSGGHAILRVDTEAGDGGRGRVTALPEITVADAGPALDDTWYIGAAYHPPTDRIYLAPLAAPTIGVFDVATETIVTNVAGIAPSRPRPSGERFASACVDARNGLVWMFARSGASLHLNPETTAVTFHGSPTAANDGNFISAVYDGARYVYLAPIHNQANSPFLLRLDTWFVPSPTSAVSAASDDPLFMTRFAMSPALWRRTASGQSTLARDLFVGGCFDGHRLWIVPFGAPNVVSFDPRAATFTAYDASAITIDGFASDGPGFTGAICDGRQVWLLPHFLTHIVRVDQYTGEMNVVPWRFNRTISALDMQWAALRGGPPADLIVPGQTVATVVSRGASMARDGSVWLLPSRGALSMIRFRPHRAEEGGRGMCWSPPSAAHTHGDGWPPAAPTTATTSVVATASASETKSRSPTSAPSATVPPLIERRSASAMPTPTVPVLALAGLHTATKQQVTSLTFSVTQTTPAPPIRFSSGGGPTPLTEGGAAGTAATVTATAAATVAAVSVLAPSSASQPARLAGAVGLARCGRGLEAPSYLEHPLQFGVFGGAEQDGGEDDEPREPVPQLASSTVWTLGLLLALCAPGLFVVAPAILVASPRGASSNSDAARDAVDGAAKGDAVGGGSRAVTAAAAADDAPPLPKPAAWLKHAGMALAVGTAYFAPSAAASAAALLYRGAYAYVGAAAAAVALALLAVHARAVPHRPGGPGDTSPAAGNSGRVAAVVGVAFDGLRAAPPPPSSSRAVAGPPPSPADALVPWHFVAEVGVGVAFGAVTGVQPPESAGLGTCRALGVLGIAVAAGYVGFVVAVRPLASRVESALSVAVAVGQLGLAGLAALASWGGPAASSADRYASWFDVGVLAITGLLFTQAAAAAAASLLCRGRRGPRDAAEERAARSAAKADALPPESSMSLLVMQERPASPAAAGSGSRSGPSGEARGRALANPLLAGRSGT